MKNILIISTGGTFNKVYNPHNGLLEIDQTSKSIEHIASKWLCEFEIMSIIGKDSLDLTSHDRLELLGTISQSKYKYIIVVHGTDTMDITAEYLADGELEKCIILTGAMVPYSMDPVEASANLASAYGYLQAVEKDGVYIAMNGIVGTHDKVKKNRKKGCFTFL
jgi:L-asparaginase